MNNSNDGRTVVNSVPGVGSLGVLLYPLNGLCDNIFRLESSRVDAIEIVIIRTSMDFDQYQSV